jgi:hypothetical protein
MSKVSALQASLEKTSGKAAPGAAHSAVSPPRAAPAAAVGAYIGAYLHPNFKRSLRLVQAQTGEDVQTLVTRALNDLFAAHNVPVVDQE